MTTRLLGVSTASIYEPHRRSFDMMANLLGWDVHVACPLEIGFVNGKAPTPFSPPPPDARYALHPLEHRFYHQQRLHLFVGLERLVARIRPDVVFVEYDPGSLPILQAKAAPMGQRVIAFTVENIERNRWRDCLDNARARKPKAAARDCLVATIGALGNRASDGLACISAEGKRIFQKQGWTKPIEVVPLGTDLRAFSPAKEVALRDQLGLSDKFVVGYFGRLVPEKGVHILLEALAMTDSRVALLLDMYANFAPGSYADQLMRTADELGVRDRITCIDVPHSEVPRYMRCADVLALPSIASTRWKEQFGRVLPEAMACEIPVIGTHSGNIPDMIGDAGILVAEGDMAALAAAIEALRTDVARRTELGKAGRARVVERFSLEAQARALQRLVAQLA